MTLVITPGTKGYVDIDGIACTVALYEFYKTKEKVGICWAEKITATIPKRFHIFIKSFEHKIPKNDDMIILVDVSDANFLEKQCGFNLDTVIKIFDHHPGYEDFWKEKIGKNAQIEEIGSAATQVANFIIENNGFDLLSNETKELLACAILSNSINFTLSITQDLDKDIYKKILKELKIRDEDFRKTYFKEVDDNYLSQPEYFLNNDIKYVKIDEKTIKISQIEMTENKYFIEKYIGEIQKILDTKEEYSFLISSSALNQITYFVSFCDTTKKLLEETLCLKFDGDILTFKGVMLRKEILKKLLNKLG